MKLVIIESPYNGETDAEIQANITYGRLCIRDSLLRGESPIASHILLTLEGILDDKIPAERALGMNAGHAWIKAADYSVAYYDRGISDGMVEGIRVAVDGGGCVVYRMIGGEDSSAPVD